MPDASPLSTPPHAAPDAHMIEARVHRLERRLRAWQCGAVTAGAGVLLGALLALHGHLGSPQLTGEARAEAAVSPTAASASVMTVNQLVMVDAEGRARAMLGMLEGRGPALVLYDEAGNGRAMLAQSGIGPALTMVDGNNRTRMRLNVSDGAGPSLVLRDGDGKVRSLMSVVNDRPAMQLLDFDGRSIIWSAPPQPVRSEESDG